MQFSVFQPEWDAMKLERNNLHVAVDRVGILLRIREFLVLDLNPETGYRE
jgi:hypothetical protein